jgi:effector-binding domain-containing protein
MIDTPKITQAPIQQIAMIHITVPRPEIQKVMGPGLSEVMSAVAAQGIATTGPWFSHHLKMDPQIFDFDICVPVASPVTAKGRVKPGLLPSSKVARTIYHGPYKGLGEAWGEFGAWIKAKGLTPAEDLWECCVVGPESSPDPSTWRTELNRPLQEPT